MTLTQRSKKGKFKVEFELKNIDYCAGCPCGNNDIEQGFSCNLFDYYDMAPEPYNLKYKRGRLLRCDECKKKLEALCSPNA